MFYGSFFFNNRNFVFPHYISTIIIYGTQKENIENIGLNEQINVIYLYNLFQIE